MIVLGIDPGLDTGWAVFSENRLIDCGLGDPRPLRNRTYLIGRISKVVIERPQIYQGRQSKANPNDLITLAIQVGRYTEAFADYEVEHILPHTWKGTVNPDVLCNRVVESLSTDESAVLSRGQAAVARCKQHNVIDAVGLAKWSLKRARAGVF